MKWNVIALIIVAVAALFFLAVVAGPAAGQNSTQPSAGNNRIYFKCQNNDADLWMDANAAMNDSESSYGNNVVGQGPYSQSHALRPVLDHDLHFDTTIQLHIQFKLDRGGADSGGDVTITLTAGNATLVDATASGSGSDFTYDGDVPVEMINASDNLVFSWEYTFTGETTYTFHTTENYYIELPIVNDTDNDGIPDNKDDDDDNDGYTDDEERAAGTDPLDANSHPSGSSDGGSDDDSDNPMPGFESLIVLAAVPVAIIAFRRRF